MVEPAISLVSASTFRSVNTARRERRLLILWPVGLAMIVWGVVCLLVSIPPQHIAQWFLLLIALPCLGKGIVTMFFSTHLAKVSEEVEASRQMRFWKCLIGLAIGCALVGWGLTLL